MTAQVRIVLDTNVLIRAVASAQSPSARLIELAIEGRATHLATFDRDLLSLATAKTDASKRFRQRLPNLRVLIPEELLLEYPQLEP